LCRLGGKVRKVGGGGDRVNCATAAGETCDVVPLRGHAARYCAAHAVKADHSDAFHVMLLRFRGRMARGGAKEKGRPEGRP